MRKFREMCKLPQLQSQAVVYRKNCWHAEIFLPHTPMLAVGTHSFGGPSACSKRGCFHCQAKIKIIFVSSSIFDSNDAESVEKSHPPFRLVMRVALIVFQIYGLQKQGRNGEGVDADFSTASEFRQGKQDADSRGARGSSWVSFVF